MNTIYINIALRFIVLILAQGLVFNKFDFLGVYDPYISLVFILIFPVKISRISFLIISFFFGLSLDYFSNSLGLNATAFITIAYLKPSIMNFVFGNFYDPYGVKMIKHYIIESTIYQKILYVFIIIFLHHLIIFSLESFSIDQILIVFKKTIYSSFLSFIFCFSFIYLFKNER
jgi:hypothetical protein|tara:strand:+ start:2628 stop:3146 length:519 start_codon:yes stop_codon:yes gene_type:complete